MAQWRNQPTKKARPTDHQDENNDTDRQHVRQKLKHANRITSKASGRKTFKTHYDVACFHDLLHPQRIELKMSQKVGNQVGERYEHIRKEAWKLNLSQMKNGLVEYLRSEDPILSIRLLYKPSCRELLATEVKEIIQHKRNNIQTEINNDEKKSAKLYWIFGFSKS